MKTTDPTGTKLPDVPKIVAVTWVWPRTGVVTLIVVVVITVSPAPPLNCTVCTWLVFRLLSAILTVPVIGTAVVGAKSITKEQLVPEARVDDGEPGPSCGQLLLLSNEKPAGMLGFWPDAGAVNVSGAVPIFVTITVWLLLELIWALGKVSALAATFTTLRLFCPTIYRLPVLSIARASIWSGAFPITVVMLPAAVIMRTMLSVVSKT